MIHLLINYILFLLLGVILSISKMNSLGFSLTILIILGLMYNFRLI